MELLLLPPPPPPSGLLPAGKKVLLLSAGYRLLLLSFLLPLLSASSAILPPSHTVRDPSREIVRRHSFGDEVHMMLSAETVHAAAPEKILHPSPAPVRPHPGIGAYLTALSVGNTEFLEETVKRIRE